MKTVWTNPEVKVTRDGTALILTINLDLNTKVAMKLRKNYLIALLKACDERALQKMVSEADDVKEA